MRLLPYRLAVPVSNIRYSQDLILPYFDYSKRSLKDVVEQIRSGTLACSDFPDIFVWLYGGLFFTHNNRWLWVFREAGVERAVVKLFCHRKTDAAGQKFMTFEYTQNYYRYSHPGYSPEFRNLQVPDHCQLIEKQKPQVRKVQLQVPNDCELTQKAKPSVPHLRRSWNRIAPSKSAVQQCRDTTEERPKRNIITCGSTSGVAGPVKRCSPRIAQLLAKASAGNIGNVASMS